MYKVVLLRHGESPFNKANRFCGWTDVGLTTKGQAEAKTAARAFKKGKYSFNYIFESILKRSWQTTKLATVGVKDKDCQIIKDWRLNERHYGDLQGRNKAEIRAKFGDKQFMLWRRGYSVRPPKITKDNPTYNNVYSNPKYQGIKIPLTESLADVVKRAVPFWQKEVIPQIKAGKKILISAHGNSLRALVKHLDKLSVKEITALNLPTGIPLVYELDKNFKPIKHYYLGDKKKIQAAIDKVKNQGKK